MQNDLTGMLTSRRVLLIIAVILLSLLAIAITGCSVSRVFPRYAGNPIERRETVVQVSTIDALMNGVYDGVMPVEAVREYGDFGIGTYAGLDGEMLEVGGTFYQIKADGIAYRVSDATETPFAAVTFFDIDREERLSEGLSYGQLQEFLDSVIPTENIFYAIRVDGTFSYMKTRSVPAQQKPYPLLAEVVKNQPVFEFNNVEGTNEGFRCPAYVAGLNVPGYHLHFITKGRDAGGHVLEFTVRDAVAYVDNTSEFLMILPGEGSDFYKIGLGQSGQGDVEKVEK